MAFLQRQVFACQRGCRKHGGPACLGKPRGRLREAQARGATFGEFVRSALDAESGRRLHHGERLELLGDGNRGADHEQPG